MAGVPDLAVGFLLENLKEFVAYNADLIAGAEGNVRDLCMELEVLKSYLKECTEEYSNNDFLDKLARNFRKLVFRAEDAIETYIASALRQRSRGVFAGALHGLEHAMELRNIEKETDAIKQEVQQLFNAKVSLGLQAMPDDRGHERRVKKPPVDDDMVGFKDALEELMRLLNGGPEGVQVISIVGMPGLGKTMLTRKLFKHPTVKYQFSIHAFVQISEEYNSKEVFLKILHCFGNVTEEMDQMSDDVLAEAIRSCLEKTNFLIVLDDVWTPEVWDDLKRAFPTNQKRSRILITTRHKNVAEHARQGFKFKPHYLRFLTNEESRELLRMKVFGKDPFPWGLVEHETRILDRCNGLPLAIVVVAGILINHCRESHWWKKVAENLDTYNQATRHQANDVIKFSFYNLPNRLKPCFLYLGVFPEDFEIPAKTLLQLWVSEGFVPQANGEESSDDIAEDYLEELVDRSLVMVEKRRLNGRIKTIRIHDTLRDFCKVQAVKEEFFREIKRIEPGANISPDDDRRLCINSDLLEYIRSRPSGKYIRSFLSFPKEEVHLPIELISTIPKAFKLVRVLDIRSIHLIRFPAELYYLFLLKYIAMFCNLKIIPEKMSNLRYLQTLIFKTRQRYLVVKADIWKIAQLRHLETNVSTTLLKTKETFSINQNLQTLSAISPETCRIDVLKRAPNIKKLGICGKLEASLFESLSSLKCVENLKLFHEDSQMCALPETTNFPETLTKLTLQNTLLDWEYMSILGKLENLEVLKLKENAFVGNRWETVDLGFRRLKVLHIGKTNLAEWEATASNFPMLRCLILIDCNKLREIPSGIGRISSLQSINLARTNRRVALSALNIQRLKIQTCNLSKTSKTLAFELSFLPAEHLDSESTRDDKQSDEVTEENEPRGEAPQEIEVSADAKAPRCLPLYKKICNKFSEGSNG